MFAVPGWAVSTSDLVQENVERKNRGRAAGNADSNLATKKRKRGVEEHDQRDVGSFPSNTATFAKKESGKTRLPKGQANPLQKPQQVTIDHSSETNTQANVHDVATSAKNHKKAQRDKNGIARSGPNVEQPSIPHRNGRERPHVEASQEAKSLSSIPPAPPMNAKLTPLQAKMRSKLVSARFRHLNETLYTTSSFDALSLFTNSPELFADYHAGFSQQVQDSWPQNPVDGYIKAVKTRGVLVEPSHGTLPLPRRKTGSCTIADLGCGDAPLARGCQAQIKSMKLKFHNFDLHSPNTLVTKADMTNLPLRDGEADIVVFCLSLMGTNWISFVEEAWRILRGDGKGEVWVAEVKSRFGRAVKGRVVDNSVGKRRKKPQSRAVADADGYDAPEQYIEADRDADQADDETDVSAFIKVFTRRGFQLREGTVNKSNKMFVSMLFTKSGIPTAGKHKGLKWNGKEYVKPQLHGEGRKRFIEASKTEDEVSPEEEAKVLKPCVYKSR